MTLQRGSGTPEWFLDWKDPVEYFARARKLQDGVPSSDLFLNNQHKFTREAWASGKFSEILGQRNQIRIRACDPGDNPDFELLVDNECWPFELTYADYADRKIGEEYRNSGTSKELKIEPIDVPTAEDVEEALTRVISKKAKKNYDPPRHLLVYVNFSTLAKGFALSIAEIAEIAQPWGNHFPSIWLLWSEKVFRAWPLTPSGKMLTLGDPTT